MYTMCAGSPWPTMTSNLITVSSTIASSSPIEPVTPTTTSFDHLDTPIATSFDPSVPTISCGVWISSAKKAVPEAVPLDQINIILRNTKKFCTPQLEGVPRGNVAIPNQKADPVIITFPFKGAHDGEIEMYMAWDPRKECKDAEPPVIEAASSALPDQLCLETLNNVTDGCGTYGGVVYTQCRMYGW